MRKLQKKLSVRCQHLVLFRLLCDFPNPRVTQASRDGVLELELRDIEKLDKPMGPRRRYARNGNTASPSLRHTVTRAVSR